MNNRLVAAVLLGTLVIAASLFARLPHTRAAFLSQSVTSGISQNERKLVKSNWKGEPLRVNTLKRRGNTTELGQAFIDADNDWLKGFSLNVTNTSNKDIVFIELSLTFFSKEKKPGRTPVEYRYSTVRPKASSMVQRQHIQFVRMNPLTSHSPTKNMRS